MSGQMCWLSNSKTDDQLILHLRERSFDSWLPYTACPHHQVPEYPIPNGTKGWSTFQTLSQEGWTLIPTAQAQNAFVAPDVQHISITQYNFGQNA